MDEQTWLETLRGAKAVKICHYHATDGDGHTDLNVMRWDKQRVLTVPLGPEPFSAEDVQPMAAILSKVGIRLRTLDLSLNGIRDGGAAAVATALRTCTSLLTLRLENNHIGNPGATALGSALAANATLTELYLDMNDIGVTGARALAGGVTEETGLRVLSLRLNAGGDECCRIVRDAMRRIHPAQTWKQQVKRTATRQWNERGLVKREVGRDDVTVKPQPIKRPRSASLIAMEEREKDEYRSTFGRPGLGHSFARAPRDPPARPPSPGPTSYNPEPKRRITAKSLRPVSTSPRRRPSSAEPSTPEPPTPAPATTAATPQVAAPTPVSAPVTSPRSVHFAADTPGPPAQPGGSTNAPDEPGTPAHGPATTDITMSADELAPTPKKSRRKLELRTPPDVTWGHFGLDNTHGPSIVGRGPPRVWARQPSPGPGKYVIPRDFEGDPPPRSAHINTPSKEGVRAQRRREDLTREFPPSPGPAGYYPQE